jgi:alkylation response protein AidB-like acyl-CoA dehydrogenase
MPGVRVKKMQTQGMRASGTGYITFEDVKVPVRFRGQGRRVGGPADVNGVCSHLIGKENHGFKAIMYDFNHGARAQR